MGLINSKYSYASFFLTGVLFVYLINFNYILNHFYSGGAYLFDSGYFASLMESKDMRILNPSSILHDSYFRTHLAPIFILCSWISQFSGISGIKLFAHLQAISYALLFLLTYLLITVHPCKQNYFKWSKVLGYIAGLLFVFSAFSVEIILYPHFEIAIPAMICLVAYSLLRKNRVLFILGIIFLLSTREDAGLHLSCLLVLVIGACYVNKEYSRMFSKKQLLMTVAITATYSVAAIFLQRIYFPGDSALTRVYLGDPILSHITVDFLFERIVYYYRYKLSFFIPIVILISYAILAKRPYALLGLISSIPWFMMHILAVSDTAGLLNYYYVFPIFWSYFWILCDDYIYALTGTQKKKLGSRNLLPTAVFILIMVASLVTLKSMKESLDRVFSWGFYGVKDSTISCYDTFLSRLEHTKNELGELRADESIMALRPNLFFLENRLSERDSRPINSILYFDNAFQSYLAKQVAALHGIDNLYQVPGTNIKIYSTKSINDMPNIGPMLIKLDPGLSSLRSDYFQPNQTAYYAPKGAPAGVLMYGPYIDLGPGRYQAIYDIKIELYEGDKPLIKIDVVYNNGRNEIESEIFFFEHINKKTKIEFDIKQSVDDLEVRLWNIGHASYWINGFSIKRID